MKILIKNKYWKLNEDYDIDKILYLLVDRPSYFNNYCFHEKDLTHRNYDLPAIINSVSTIFWCEENSYHRDNSKPAAIWPDGSKEHYTNNKFIKLIKKEK